MSAWQRAGRLQAERAGFAFGAVHVGQAQPAGVLAGAIGRQPQNDHARRMAGEGLALEGHAGQGVRDAVQALVEQQLAPVALHRPAAAGQFDEDVAEGLVGAHVPVVAGPQRDLVELQVLAGDVAEEHPAQAPVAYRQRLALPARRRVRREPLVAQRQFGGDGGGRRACQRRRQDQRTDQPSAWRAHVVVPRPQAPAARGLPTSTPRPSEPM